MSEKRTTEKLSNTVLVLIVIGIVVTVNVLASQYFRRADFTENKLYTISDVTKDIVSNLDDIVSIKAYFSDPLPVQIQGLPQEVDDMLYELRIKSQGNLTYERINPMEDEELQQKLAQKGIMPVQMTVVEKDQRQQINGWLAMTISYGEKTEVIPVVQNTTDLEYEITSRIYRLTNEPRQVAFITNGSRHSLDTDYQRIAQEIGSLHEIQPVEVEPGAGSLDNFETIIFSGPQEIIPEDVLYEIDQFIMKGGRAIFLIDDITLDERGQPTVVEHGMHDFLSSYGFDLDRNLVADNLSHSVRSVQLGIFTQQQPFKLYPRIMKNQLGDFPVVSRLSEFTLQYTGSFKFNDKQSSEVADNVLATSTNQVESFKPPTYQPATLSEPVDFVGLATGIFKSYFTNREKPESVDQSAFISKSKEETSVIVIPCSDFITNQLLYPGNSDLMLNLVDFLTIGDKLISIRTRPVSNRPIKEISPEMKNMLRILNIIGVPLLIILFGMGRFYLRRRDKSIQERSKRESSHNLNT